MNTKEYWKFQKIIYICIFKIKNLIYSGYNWKQSTKQYKSFEKILFFKAMDGILKSSIIAIFLHNFDSLFLKITKFTINTTNNNILLDVIIGELGVAGVILGLYCTNISTVYSSKFSNAPDEITKAYHEDKLTNKCINSIIGFIIFGTIIIIEILLGLNIGWLTTLSLILWSLIVVISYGLVGNKTYQLSNAFMLSNNSFIILKRLISKNLSNNLFSSDINYQNYFYELAIKHIRFLKIIQKYECSSNNSHNSALLNFMCTNLEIIKQYWEIKQTISKNSLWFHRKGKYQKWHLAGNLETSIALKTGTSLTPKEEPDYYWFENEIMSLNHSCINNLINSEDFESIYNYFSVFKEITKTAIQNKEANYFVGQIDWLKNTIQEIANKKNMNDNIVYTGIIEHISILYLEIIMETSKYYQNLDMNSIYNSIINAIDSGKQFESLKEIRGRDNIEIYKSILIEIRTEGTRITPNWVIKQYIAKEEYVYLNSLNDLIKESIEHAYSLGNFFLEKNMYYEACIIFIRFYEYESKLSNFYNLAQTKKIELEKYCIDKNDKWDEWRLNGIKQLFLSYKKDLPKLLLNCAGEFSIKKWNCRDEYPDFLGACYNHISEDTVNSLTNNNKEQYKANFTNLTKIMLLYQEYIRSDFIKNKDLYRIEYAYYMFTSPIVEWAQIGGLGILWGEFFEDKEWSKIVNDAFKTIFSDNGKNNNELITLAEKLIEYVQQRDKFMFGISSRSILETSWNQYVENIIRKSKKIETEYTMFNLQVKTKSKLLNSFCPNFMNTGFSIDPSEVFWVVCVNPLLSNEKKFHTKFSWEDKLYD